MLRFVLEKPIQTPYRIVVPLKFNGFYDSPQTSYDDRLLANNGKPYALCYACIRSIEPLGRPGKCINKRGVIDL